MPMTGVVNNSYLCAFSLVWFSSRCELWSVALNNRWVSFVLIYSLWTVTFSFISSGKTKWGIADIPFVIVMNCKHDIQSHFDSRLDLASQARTKKMSVMIYCQLVIFLVPSRIAHNNYKRKKENKIATWIMIRMRKILFFSLLQQDLAQRNLPILSQFVIRHFAHQFLPHHSR